MTNSPYTSSRQPLEDQDLNLQDSGFFSELSEDSRSSTGYFPEIINLTYIFVFNSITYFNVY